MASKVALGLTDAKLKGLKPPASGQAEYRDQAVPGLRVRVGVSGTKTFILRKRVGGKWRNITIGRYSERLSLAAARKKARALLSDIEFKADPVAALPKLRKREPAGHSIRALWPDYRAAKADRRKIGEVVWPEDHRDARELPRRGAGEPLPYRADRRPARAK